MRRKITWNENDVIRDVIGRFAKELGAAAPGDVVELQDGSARIKVAQSKDIPEIPGNNTKAYVSFAMSEDGQTPQSTTRRPHADAEEAARQALTYSARKRAPASLGGTERHSTVEELERKQAMAEPTHASEMDALEQVYENFAMSTSEVANTLGITRAQAFKMLRSLESKGIISSMEMSDDGSTRIGGGKETRARGQDAKYIDLTWQSNQTYDDHTWDEVKATAKAKGASEEGSAKRGAKTPEVRAAEKAARRKAEPLSDRQITVLGNAASRAFDPPALIKKSHEELDALIAKAKQDRDHPTKQQTLGEQSAARSRVTNLQAIAQLKSNPKQLEQVMAKAYEAKYKQVRPNWSHLSKEALALELKVDPEGKKHKDLVEAVVHREIGTERDFLRESFKRAGYKPPRHLRGPAPEGNAAQGGTELPARAETSEGRRLTVTSEDAVDESGFQAGAYLMDGDEIVAGPFASEADARSELKRIGGVEAISLAGGDHTKRRRSPKNRGAVRKPSPEVSGFLSGGGFAQQEHPAIWSKIERGQRLTPEEAAIAAENIASARGAVESMTGEEYGSSSSRRRFLKSSLKLIDQLADIAGDLGEKGFRFGSEDYRIKDEHRQRVERMHPRQDLGSADHMRAGAKVRTKGLFVHDRTGGGFNWDDPRHTAAARIAFRDAYGQYDESDLSYERMDGIGTNRDWFRKHPMEVHEVNNTYISFRVPQRFVTEEDEPLGPDEYHFIDVPMPGSGRKFGPPTQRGDKGPGRGTAPGLIGRDEAERIYQQELEAKQRLVDEEVSRSAGENPDPAPPDHLPMYRFRPGNKLRAELAYFVTTLAETYNDRDWWGLEAKLSDTKQTSLDLTPDQEENLRYVLELEAGDTFGRLRRGDNGMDPDDKVPASVERQALRYLSELNERKTARENLRKAADQTRLAEADEMTPEANARVDRMLADAQRALDEDKQREIEGIRFQLQVLNEQVGNPTQEAARAQERQRLEARLRELEAAPGAKPSTDSLNPHLNTPVADLSTDQLREALHRFDPRNDEIRAEITRREQIAERDARIAAAEPVPGIGTGMNTEDFAQSAKPERDLGLERELQGMRPGETREVRGAKVYRKNNRVYIVNGETVNSIGSAARRVQTPKPQSKREQVADRLTPGPTTPPKFEVGDHVQHVDHAAGSIEEDRERWPGQILDTRIGDDGGREYLVRWGESKQEIWAPEGFLMGEDAFKVTFLEQEISQLRADVAAGRVKKGEARTKVADIKRKMRGLSKKKSITIPADVVEGLSKTRSVSDSTKKTFTATFPDGTTAKRTSDKRDYRFASLKNGEVKWHETRGAAQRRRGTVVEVAVVEKGSTARKASGKSASEPRRTPSGGVLKEGGTFHPLANAKGLKANLAAELAGLNDGAVLKLPDGIKAKREGTGRFTIDGKTYKSVEAAADAMIEASARNTHEDSIGGSKSMDVTKALKNLRAKARRLK